MTDAASRSPEAAPDSPTTRAALYLRVSTNPQAEHDLSIPDQKRQAETYCTAKGWQIVAEYVEPGQSATDDKRPEFQGMMDAALHGGTPFDAVLVHSFSRFFRDQFQLELYVRKLAKADVRLVLITQDLGDDPMSAMICQIMALIDEYQSKENAKHVLRAMKDFARAARKRLRKSDGSYRRDHLRAVAQRIEVIDKTEARIMGSRTALLKTLTAASA